MGKKSRELVSLNFKEKKIKDYESQDFAELDIFLLALCKFTGISEVPDAEHRKLILSFLFDNFSDFSKAEINKAFNLALSFQLDVKDLSHYNKLSPLWISSILIAYRSYRGKELVKYNNLVAESKLSKTYTEKEVLDLNISTTIEKFNDYKEGGVIYDFGNVSYLFLEKINLINLSSKEKADIFDEAKVKYVSELNSNKPVNAKTSTLTDVQKKIKEIRNGGLTSTIQSEARKIGLKNYFDDLINFDINLEDKIKEALKP